jgi:hypothetical protein
MKQPKLPRRAATTISGEPLTYRPNAIPKAAVDSEHAKLLFRHGYFDYLLERCPKKIRDMVSSAIARYL